MKSSRNIRWSELRAGILTLVAITLLAFGIMQLGGKIGAVRQILQPFCIP